LKAGILSIEKRNRSSGVDAEGFVKLCGVINFFKVTGEDGKKRRHTLRRNGSYLSTVWSTSNLWHSRM